MTLSEGKSMLLGLMEELSVLVRGRRRSPWEKFTGWAVALVLAALGAGTAFLVVRKRRSPPVRKLRQAARRSLSTLRRKVGRVLQEGRTRARSYAKRLSGDLEAIRDAAREENGHAMTPKRSRARTSSTARSRRRLTSEGSRS